MSVEETYRRTMKSEGTEMRDGYFPDANQYTFSSETIRDVYNKNIEICKQKRLNIEQTLDAFILALVDMGMDQDEAEEVCEVYDRTDGQFFSEEGDDFGEDEEELEEDDLPPDEDDDWGNPDREDLPDDIIEV